MYFERTCLGGPFNLKSPVPKITGKQTPWTASKLHGGQANSMEVPYSGFTIGKHSPELSFCTFLLRELPCRTMANHPWRKEHLWRKPSRKIKIQWTRRNSEYFCCLSSFFDSLDLFVKHFVTSSPCLSDRAISSRCHRQQ